MESVHYNERGKYATAVYECEHPGYVPEDVIMQIFPVAWGKSVTAFDVTYQQATDSTRWHMLIANTAQTTVRDITSRTPDVKVRVKAAIPGRGYALRAGSPRAGTTRKVANSPHAKGVTAR